MQPTGGQPTGGRKLTLRTVGPLRLIDANGCDRTPKAQKARGLLALLAMSPNNQRARTVLQDKLWSDRGPVQGAASLRQTLTEIRRSLGPWRDCLMCDRTMVGLDLDQVEIVTRTPATDGSVGYLLLEGLHVRDPEFENWLRDQRSRFEDEQDKRLQSSSKSAPLVAVEPETSESERHRNSIVLRIEDTPLSPSDAVIAGGLTDIIGKSILEVGSIDVVDFRGLSQAERAELTASLGDGATTIMAGAACGPDHVTWRLVISDPITRRLIWSTVAHQDNHGTFDLGNPDVLRSLNRTVDIALANLLSAADAQDERAAGTRLCWEGIRRLTQLGRDNLEAADQLFERAHELNPRGIYLAWRAYLRTYLIAERLCSCRQTAAEEALAFLRRAMEIEPHNSYVASFGAQVHTIVRRSYIAAYELAQRSIEINPANPMGWACLGIAECHLGRSKKGLEHALVGRRIAGSSPLRFQVDALSCIAATMAGDLKTAIQCGESGHALAPTFAPPLRYLSAIYLLRGEHEQSQEKVKALQALEPDFSYTMLRDKSYPSAGLQRSRLLAVLPARQV